MKQLVLILGIILFSNSVFAIKRFECSLRAKSTDGSAPQPPEYDYGPFIFIEILNDLFISLTLESGKSNSAASEFDAESGSMQFGSFDSYSLYGAVANRHYKSTVVSASPAMLSGKSGKAVLSTVFHDLDISTSEEKYFCKFKKNFF